MSEWTLDPGYYVVRKNSGELDIARMVRAGPDYGDLNIRDSWLEVMNWHWLSGCTLRTYPSIHFSGKRFGAYRVWYGEKALRLVSFCVHVRTFKDRLRIKDWFWEYQKKRGDRVGKRAWRWLGDGI